MAILVFKEMFWVGRLVLVYYSLVSQTFCAKVWPVRLLIHMIISQEPTVHS